MNHTPGTDNLQNFVGRDSEKEIIRQWLEANKGTLGGMLIIGGGGMGKSLLLRYIQAQEIKGLVYSNIIDFNRDRYHSPESIRLSLAEHFKQTTNTSEFDTFLANEQERLQSELRDWSQKPNAEPVALELPRVTRAVQLKANRDAADREFFAAYARFADQHQQIVIFLDTVELLRKETDGIQHEIEAWIRKALNNDNYSLKFGHTSARTWLIENIKAGNFKKTRFILAGRPLSRNGQPSAFQHELAGAFQQGFAPLLPLKRFPEESNDGKKYATALRQHYIKTNNFPDTFPDFPAGYIEQAYGNPLEITIRANLFLIYDGTVAPIEALDPNNGSRDERIAGMMVEYLTRLISKLNTQYRIQTIDNAQQIAYDVWSLLGVARKGVTAAMLTAIWPELSSTDLHEAYFQTLLDQLPGDLLLFRSADDIQFLHDELYDVYERLRDRLHPENEDIRFPNKLIDQKIALYYRNQERQETNILRREEMRVARLYHELSADFQNGYLIYSKFDAQKMDLYIDGYTLELDVLLRAELLRFMRRYAPEGTEIAREMAGYHKALPELFYPLIAPVNGEVNGDTVTAWFRHRFALRWVRALLANNEIPNARLVLDNLKREVGAALQAFDKDHETFQADIIYYADLFNLIAEVYIHLEPGNIEEIEAYLAHSKALLDQYSPLEPGPPATRPSPTFVRQQPAYQWWYYRILGSMELNRGDWYYNQGRYGKARDSYSNAIYHLQGKSSREIHADALAHHAFVLGQLRNPDAPQIIEEALAIYQELYEETPLLWYKDLEHFLRITYSYIDAWRLEEDKILNALEQAQAAYYYFKPRGDVRGTLRALIALGHAYRRAGNIYKLRLKNSNSLSEDDWRTWITYFDEAITALNLAIRWYHDQPVENLYQKWEAHSELGSALCDYAAFLQRAPGVQDMADIETRYREAVAASETAAKIAQDGNLIALQIDAWEDVAQTWDDLFRWYQHHNNMAEANRAKAQRMDFTRKIEESVTALGRDTLLTHDVANAGMKADWYEGDTIFFEIGKIKTWQSDWELRDIEDDFRQQPLLSGELPKAQRNALQMRFGPIICQFVEAALYFFTFSIYSTMFLKKAVSQTPSLPKIFSKDELAKVVNEQIENCLSQRSLETVETITHQSSETIKNTVREAVEKYFEF